VIPHFLLCISVSQCYRLLFKHFLDLQLEGDSQFRESKLLEVLMRDALKIEIDEEMVCGIEHHMKDMFTEALLCAHF
jgi:Mn-dependent DtxR family transcriptional regulator